MKPKHAWPVYWFTYKWLLWTDSFKWIKSINRNLNLFEPVILSGPKTYSTTTANWFTNIQLLWVESKAYTVTRNLTYRLLCCSVTRIKNIQSNLYSPIPKQMTLMIRFFLVNQKYTALPVLLWVNSLINCWKRVPSTSTSANWPWLPD